MGIINIKTIAARPANRPMATVFYIQTSPAQRIDVVVDMERTSAGLQDLPVEEKKNVLLYPLNRNSTYYNRSTLLYYRDKHIDSSNRTYSSNGKNNIQKVFYIQDIQVLMERCPRGCLSLHFRKGECL
jgi:hypothetical protein